MEHTHVKQLFIKLLAKNTFNEIYARDTIPAMNQI